MEIKWATPEYQTFLIVRLGGLHTLMNFCGVIGTHIKSSGLPDAWVESKMIGPKTAEQVLSGHSYARAIRAHKLTLQALWEILLPQIIEFAEEDHPDSARTLQNILEADNIEELLLFR